MKQEDIQQALAYIKSNSPERNFKQSVELIINLRGLNLKKPEEQVDIFHQLPNHPGREPKICALVGGELKDQAQEYCDKVILNDEFEQYSDKKQIKKLASQYDYFIAQAPFMAQIAKIFGRYFGPKGKMPNPKAGCVVPPNANLGQVTQRLKNTVRLFAKQRPLIQLLVGRQDMEEAQVVENIMSVYNALVHKLPGEESNIRSVYLKYTMGPPVKVGEVPQ